MFFFCRPEFGPGPCGPLEMTNFLLGPLNKLFFLGFMASPSLSRTENLIQVYNSDIQFDGRSDSFVKSFTPSILVVVFLKKGEKLKFYGLICQFSASLSLDCLRKLKVGEFSLTSSKHQYFPHFTFHYKMKRK